MINSVLKMQLRPPINRVGAVFHFPLSVCSSLQHGDMHLLNALDATGCWSPSQIQKLALMPKWDSRGIQAATWAYSPSTAWVWFRATSAPAGAWTEGLYGQPGLHLKWSLTPSSAYKIWGHWEHETHFCPCKYPIKTVLMTKSGILCMEISVKSARAEIHVVGGFTY